ncbi:choice-of-anchor D domain-containing protein [Polluticoccus soli]|uniref:choice-of-anchor D domain-containing protein n=1 Tax=Polluticoccus soli TaxID=3034150 RepID=UPI0023E22E39|nr:choice-of-anchor D domain-containing protein [Flavipsychrobacter sp. JY13-12]
MKQSLLVATSLLALAQTDVMAQVTTGPSTAQSPYVVPVAADVKTTSILSAGETVNGYKMSGLPDGSGAWDNGDGTFTLLVNHEIGSTSGAIRAHGSIGAYVSRWIIKKSDLTVLNGSDLITKINLWNPSTLSYATYYASNPSTSAALNRFCSGDLPAVSAFYNPLTGAGTQNRIYMNGEENGTEGRAFGHIASGPDAGTSYELPHLGKFSFENSVARPNSDDKTVVIGMDDATPGQVYIYIGTKTNVGTDIHKAGLANGKLYSVAVQGMLIETSASFPAPATPFTMVDLGNVSTITGATLQTNSNNAGVTQFLRPEDGAWDPSNNQDFYFVTTNAFNSPSRLWKLHFTNGADLTQGGTITAVLDGTEGQQMLDNMGIDHYGHILLQEDVGGNAHIGKIWQYTITNDSFKVIAEHDNSRFLTGGANFLTQDEEASGIFDAQEILGSGMWIGVDQAHYSLPSPTVEGGQLFALFNPASFNSNPEISLEGNGNVIITGDNTPSTSDNTDLGNIAVGSTITKTFTIKNAGPASLTVTGAAISGENANEFTIMGGTFPMTIAAGASQTITVEFKPTALGLRKAVLNVASNDFDESAYVASLQGVGLNTTDIANLDGASTMKLYPNPTGDAATVEISLKNPEQVVVTVLDMQGRVTLQPIANKFSTGAQKVMINTSNLANGTYFVQIAVGNVTTKTKLVVAH